MTLENLLSTVSSSHPSDWHTMEDHTVYEWLYGTNPEGNFIEPKTHTGRAVYKPDIDVAFVWGASDTDSFEESWTREFPSPLASMVSIQLLYRGSPVHRWTGVLVDGSRYLLPLPTPDGQGGYVIERSDLTIPELLFHLRGSGGAHNSVISALERAGVAVK